MVEAAIVSIILRHVSGTTDPFGVMIVVSKIPPKERFAHQFRIETSVVIKMK